MMWFRCIMLSLGSCVALRTHSASAKVAEKMYTVQVALTSTDPKTQAGSSIDIAVNGLRHLSRTHPTQTGNSVMLRHIPRGSVVTAHVHASEEACAYWVGTSSKQFTVGGWGVAFAASDESDEISSTQLFEAYAKVVGKGRYVTIEINHVAAKIFDTQPNTTSVFPGLQRGALIKAVSASGDTCMNRVGKRQVKCNLDNSWGLLLGSVAEKENDMDEGVSVTRENFKNYTVQIHVTPQTIQHGRWIEIKLNGSRIARKVESTKPDNAIMAYHVAGGSVITAVSPSTGEACAVYVGTGMQNQTCAGWALNFEIQDETDQKFEIYDVKYTVHPVSANTTGSWSLKYGNYTGSSFLRPQLFPMVDVNKPKGIHIVPVANDVPADNCVHVVGGDKTSCVHDGWAFTMESYINMNKLGGSHWDYVDDGDDDDEIQKVKMTAFDTTESKSFFECIAGESMEYSSPPLGETETHVDEGKPMFKNVVLTRKLEKYGGKTVSVKSATITVEFELDETPVHDGGFVCTVYDKHTNKMCEADSAGRMWTTVQGCTMEIEWLD